MCNNCQEEQSTTTFVKLSLLNNKLGVTVNGTTAFIQLSSPNQLDIAFTSQVIPITTNGQTLFEGVIGVTQTIFDLKVDGVTQRKNVDYSVDETDIIWSGDFTLKTSHHLEVVTYG